MSEMFSRRVFMRGLGVVAAAAALTACSSTNEAVNQALIEGAVGGIVAADCKIGRMHILGRKCHCSRLRDLFQNRHD